MLQGVLCSRVCKNSRRVHVFLAEPPILFLHFPPGILISCEVMNLKIANFQANLHFFPVFRILHVS